MFNKLESEAPLYFVGNAFNAARRGKVIMPANTGIPLNLAGLLAFGESQLTR